MTAVLDTVRTVRSRLQGAPTGQRFLDRPYASVQLLLLATGASFTGMIVYEAVDGLILQTGPDTTVRVAGTNIETKRTLDTSLMPVGLLDKLTDREVADLLAYLRTLDDLKPR